MIRTFSRILLLTLILTGNLRAEDTAGERAKGELRLKLIQTDIALTKSSTYGNDYDAIFHKLYSDMILLLNAGWIRNENRYPHFAKLSGELASKVYSLNRDMGRDKVCKNAAYILAVLGVYQPILDMKELKTLILGLSSPDMDTRIKTFDEYKNSIGLKKALLKLVLTAKREPVRTQFNINNTCPVVGDTLNIDYQSRVPLLGCLLPANLKKFTAPFDIMIPNLPIFLEKRPIGNRPQRHGGGKRKIHQPHNIYHLMRHYRLFLGNEKELSGHYSMECKYAMIFNLKTIRAKPKFSPHTDPILQKVSHDNKDVLANHEIDSAPYFSFAIPPAKKLHGKPDNGLKLSAELFPSSKKFDARGAITTPTNFKISFTATKNRICKLINPQKNPSVKLWSMILKEYGSAVYVSSLMTIPTVNTNESNVVFESFTDKDDAISYILSLELRLPPGKYRAIFGFGPCIGSERYPVDSDTWLGELVSNEVPFSVE